MYSILFEKKFQRKSKNRLLRHESATRFWVQKLRQNQTGALLNGCTVSGAKFRGELDSGKKLDVYATKRAGLETNFWSILNKKMRRISAHFLLLYRVFCTNGWLFSPRAFYDACGIFSRAFRQSFGALHNYLSQHFFRFVHCAFRSNLPPRSRRK